MLYEKLVVLLDGNAAAADATWGVLHTHYTNPGRHYHTLQHLEHVFSFLDAATSHPYPPLVDPIAVAWAVFFHDAVMDFSRVDNEERSAELARELLGPILQDPEQLRRVHDYIIATKHQGDAPEHALDEDSDAPSAPAVAARYSRDLALFLDADLSILAAGPAAYHQYAAGVRAEYGHYSDAGFARGRVGVLRGFLQRPRLFLSDYARAQGMEAAARENMVQEISRLEQQLQQLGPPSACPLLSSSMHPGSLWQL